MVSSKVTSVRKLVNFKLCWVPLLTVQSFTGFCTTSPKFGANPWHAQIKWTKSKNSTQWSECARAHAILITKKIVRKKQVGEQRDEDHDWYRHVHYIPVQEGSALLLIPKLPSYFLTDFQYWNLPIFFWAPSNALI